MACGKALNKVSGEVGHEDHYCYLCVGHGDTSCTALCVAAGECYFEKAQPKEVTDEPL